MKARLMLKLRITTEENIMRLPKKSLFTHPGEVLREEYLKVLGISQSDFATHLGIDFKTLNRLVNERQGVSVPMAIKLSGALNTSPEFWLNMQMKHDLTKALKGNIKKPRRLPELSRAIA